ncbi:MAG: hypothetical protein ACXVAX_05795 [Pseudobdellovibrio sp.]
MKSFLALFLALFLTLFSFTLFAKTKIVFTELPDAKKLPVLYVITDYKKPVQRLISADIVSFASSEDVIAYIDKDSKLYLITDFSNLSKNFIADGVTEFRIHNGVVFYTRTTPNNPVTLNVVYDLKGFSKTELLSGYHQYSLDSD